MNDKNFDFIIIGTGLAGLYAALTAAKHGSVALVTNTTLKTSNTYLAQGGIAAVLGEDDSPYFHIADTLKAGREICKKEAVDVLIKQGIECVQSLIEWGMPFDIADGKFLFGLEGGHSKRRVLHAGQGTTGKELIGFLIPLVLNEKRITIFEKTHVDRLISENDTCKGVRCIALESESTFILSGNCTIIATGGASAIYSRTTNNDCSVGEGITLAYDIGAEIESMEFMQFHPTAFFTETNDTFLISEAVRGEGAYLVNHHGERFLKKWGLNELSPRDVVSEAMFHELKESGKQHVFLVLSHLDKDKVKTRFLNIYNNCLENHIDLSREPVPVAPAAHYTIGGIKTGLNGETNIKQLYAAGEVASTGVHGANRMASNSLLECLVFGKRAVDHAVKKHFSSNHASSQSKRPTQNNIDKKRIANLSNTTRHLHETGIPLNHLNRDRFNEVKALVGKIMWNEAGIIRNKYSLEHALKQLETAENDFGPWYDEYYQNRIRSLLEVSKMTVLSAIERKESRGCHNRSDYPERDPYFIGTIIIRKGSPTCFLEL